MLNRGNHEERSVHSMYGFQQEATQKYDRDICTAAETRTRGSFGAAERCEPFSFVAQRR